MLYFTCPRCDEESSSDIDDQPFHLCGREYGSFKCPLCDSLFAITKIKRVIGCIYILRVIDTRSWRNISIVCDEITENLTEDELMTCHYE